MPSPASFQLLPRRDPGLPGDHPLRAPFHRWAGSFGHGIGIKQQFSLFHLFLQQHIRIHVEGVIGTGQSYRLCEGTS